MLVLCDSCAQPSGIAGWNGTCLGASLIVRPRHRCWLVERQQVGSPSHSITFLRLFPFFDKRAASVRNCFVFRPTRVAVHLNEIIGPASRSRPGDRVQGPGLRHAVDSPADLPA